MTLTMSYLRTVPAASTKQDIDDIEAAMRGDDNGRKSRHHQNMHVSSLDPRFTKVIGWVGVIFAGVITWAICWSAEATVDLEKQMVGVQRDIAALVARPREFRAKSTCGMPAGGMKN